MPAEWEPHSSTWLTWPHNPETWPKQDKQKIEYEFLTIVKNLAIHETIHLLVTDQMMERSVKLSLANEGVKMENIILIFTLMLSHHQLLSSMIKTAKKFMLL